MDYSNNNKKELKFILTTDGMKVLLEKGLLNEIKLVALWDDDILYQLNKVDQPTFNLSGNRENQTLINPNNDFKYPLKDGV